MPLKMFIALGREFMRPGLVPEQNALAGHDFADAAQLQARKFFPPGIQQPDRVPAGHREQQFKVLTVGQRSQRRRLGARFVSTWLTPPGCLARSLAARETGSADFKISAPTLPASRICRKSPASPSLISSMA